MNSIDYDPVHDWIMVSVRENHEVWIIDHSTTTEEAAGHTGGNHGKGGDLLYRWGNPLAYQRGTVLDLQIFGQHDATFVPAGYPGAGNVVLFSNWDANPGQSEVVEFSLPLDGAGEFVLGTGAAYGPAQPVWTYSEPSFGSNFVSSARRLPNGNTLVCSGMQGHLFEVTQTGQVVWSYDAGDVVFHTDYVERSAWLDDDTYSIEAGGSQHMRLFAGSDAGSLPYLCLVGLSGSAPGFMLQGRHVPVQIDAVTTAVLAAPDAGPFGAMVGFLDPFGRATSTFEVPPCGLTPDFLGYELSSAFVWFDASVTAVAGVSNGMAFEFVD